MMMCRRMPGIFACLAISLLIGPAIAIAQEAIPKPETRSGQPVSDAWITTKIKADLLASKDVSGLGIHVETQNRVVRLSGKVESQAQIDTAIRIATSTDGVLDVSAAGLQVEDSIDR